MRHNTEEWCKIWWGTDLCFEKWHEEFGEFWPNSRKSQHLHFHGLLFDQGICLSWIITEKLFAMTLWSDAIFNEKLV